MKLHFTRHAARDLENIADYIRAQNPEAATSVRAAIIKSLQMR
jgi:plasmid stabilization system protein ParE